MWIWNHNKTVKLQVSKLSEICIKYNDNDFRNRNSLKTFMAVGAYEPTHSFSRKEVILFTDNDQSVCESFIDSITEEKKG